jgi:hypothetical protein
MRLEQTKALVQDIEKMLAFDGSAKPLKTLEVKTRLERIRADQHLLTSDVLAELDAVEDKYLKKLYNYSLATLREKDEMCQDLAEEYQWKKMNQDNFMIVMTRQNERKVSFNGRQRLLKKEKMDVILESMRTQKAEKATKRKR